MTCTCGEVTSGTGACSCDGGQPPPAANPAGLTEVAYRANDFNGFREALLTPLPGEVQLTGWSPSPGDLGLQVLEWWAYLADVLTFYNERIANNNYLRTAAAQPGPKRQHVAGLARLLGYLPRPGITATGYVAAIRSTGSKDQQLVIPPGLQITSTPTAHAPAQLFETGKTQAGETPAFTGPSDGLIALPPYPTLFQPAIYTFTPKSAAAGAEVTITGTGFTGVTAVSFHDASAKFTINSDTLLTATVPATATTGRIAVDTPAGTGASSASFTVTGGGTPVPGGPAKPQSVLLAGKVAVPAGDELLLVKRNWEGKDEDWAAVTAATTTTEADPNGPANTRLTLHAAMWNALDGAEQPKASDYQLLRTTATVPLWTMPLNGSGGGGGGGTSSPDTVTVLLATLVRGVAPGDNVFFTGSTTDTPPKPVKVLAHVTGYQEAVLKVPPATGSGSGSGSGLAPPRRAGPSSTTTRPKPVDAFIPQTTLTVLVPSTDVALLKEVVATPQESAGVAMRYGMREVGTLIPTPAPSLTDFSTAVTGPPGLVPPHSSREAALQDANGTGLLVTASSAADGLVTFAAVNGGSSTALDPPLTAPIRLLANLVPVSRGTTVREEILGNGDPATASQSFVLQHAPLIYLPPQGDNPPTSTLTVTVDGVAWKAESAFTGQPPDATVYVLRELPGGRMEVLFGDGVEGARLPLGTSNVTATYRYGPAGPPPPPGNVSTVLQPQPNLATVLNPVSLTPGTNPEPARQTADAAPVTVTLLGAAAAPAGSKPPIAPGDYEKLAATVSGVTRVKAYWAWDSAWQRPVIRLYAAGSGTGNTGVATEVRARIRASGAPRVPVRVKAARPVELTIECRLLCGDSATEDAVKAAAKSALTDPQTGLFSANRMAIGQRLYPSQVEAALTVTGVIAVLSLNIQRAEPAGPGGPAVAARDESFDGDPGQDGYFSLPASGPTIHVESQ
jgi:hypothetical protein